MYTVLSKTFDKLTVRELHDILRLRAEVFCVEQKAWYVDEDDYDFVATHFLIYEQDFLIAYARLYPKQDYFVIGRVCTHLFHRNKGLGKQLVEQAIKHCLPQSSIIIQAQLYLKNFYQSFGFEIIEPRIVWEDAVSHVIMKKVNL